MLKSNKKNNNMLTPVTTTIEKYEFGQDDDDDELRNNDNNNEEDSDEPLNTDNTVSFQVTIKYFDIACKAKQLSCFFFKAVAFKAIRTLSISRLELIGFVLQDIESFDSAPANTADTGDTGAESVRRSGWGVRRDSGIGRDSVERSVNPTEEKIAKVTNQRLVLCHLTLF